MKITSELILTNFEFWAGAKDHSFTYNELDELEYTLKDLYYDGMTETQINDIFWFEEEFLCESIGLNYNEYLER